MVPNRATHHIYSLMTLSHVKLVHAVTFMKYLAGVVSLIFLPKTLICNKITFLASSSLNVAESAVNELIKSISKKFTYHCLLKKFQELVTNDELHKFTKILISIVFY